MTTLTHKTIRFILETQWNKLPNAVRHQSKRCLLDALGALIAGMETPVAQVMTQFAAEQFAGDQATILVKGNRASLVGAALVNGFAGNALDIDDGHRMIKAHPGACVLPVILASGEQARCSGSDFLATFVIGYEVGIRAGLIRHARYEIFHSSGSWGAISGAAAAGKIMGLDENLLFHAMGAAEYHAPIGPMMKGIATPSMGKDSIGWGCMVAMSSVLMAQNGFTGIHPLFDDTPERSWIENLGQDYEIMNLYFKPCSACRWAQPAVEGALRIMQENALSPNEIERITVFTFAEAAALSREYPQNTEEAQYNMAFPIAAALIDGEVGPRQTLPPRLSDKDLHQMMDRIDVVAEERFQKKFPARALAEVRIQTRDGRNLRSGILSARWDPGSQLPTDAELIEKFHWLTRPVLGTEKAKEIENMIWAFETISNVEELIRCCVKR